MNAAAFLGSLGSLGLGGGRVINGGGIPDRVVRPPRLKLKPELAALEAVAVEMVA